MYRTLFSLVLSRFDPERAHRLAFAAIRALPVIGLGSLLRRFTAPDPSLAVEALGLRFDSPFGIAAGFDKDGEGVIGLGALGFGHVEVGTITARPQPGNDKPRLFRLLPDRAVINRMGFNNHGAGAAANRLLRVRRARRRPVLGVNISKSRAVAVEDATADYLISARALAPVADYLVVNVSSPNTPGLRGLQEREALAPLLSAVKAASGKKPLLVKIAPDLTDEQIVAVARLAVELGLAGIIATNTTIARDGLSSDPAVVEAAGAGGLSGAPLAARSLEVLTLIRANVPPSLCVISVGGVETAQDVQRRLDAGATLVQGYTAFLYRGPLWARQITRGLSALRSR
ncbi:dihydroorotate dehydrogenase 2 [Leifsonia xyli subsp. xyli]|uniref:Dihydroorotate dehydrogenase (quinone) n=2 Tax=Leifsonia xyli subsp. xyli TaxID=59736 RepID=PYRD_LEIXX|nr:quinone-dependent dihydroorotate dehydrogenase [Leifsonia xyli]Q6AE78.1 RecName: Full=Dihydroorotate dehydrogenase (quinone); AltName: Full=DHOdehase; Short=DHOD; Short=DHODase; AltName: Full=Dihydroorotate oxidase [Leifsonia xyli subsp. xyli str. CTCB07]AAT89318.1 dihydroorotate dehydrogenase [Leifsonia xyli subsp. xyli str. CTCB07]ODA89647.1 dihydroorotate dehydrogenase 2 [Leifsonia xyli subsp. xyli]